MRDAAVPLQQCVLYKVMRESRKEVQFFLFSPPCQNQVSTFWGKEPHRVTISSLANQLRAEMRHMDFYDQRKIQACLNTLLWIYRRTRGLKCRHFQHSQVFVYFLRPSYLFKRTLVSRTKPSELVKSSIKGQEKLLCLMDPLVNNWNIFVS